MLVLTRKLNEDFVIVLPDGREIEVKLVEIRGDKCRLGITADRDIVVHRREVLERIRQSA